MPQKTLPALSKVSSFELHSLQLAQKLSPKILSSSLNSRKNPLQTLLLFSFSLQKLSATTHNALLSSSAVVSLQKHALFFFLCSSAAKSLSPPQKLSLRKMKNPLQEASCPSSQKILSRISHSRQWALPSSCSPFLSLLRTLLKISPNGPEKETKQLAPRSSNRLQLFADSLDTC